MFLSHPLVSCCISTWNRVDDLYQCIESIQAQNYPNIEIVIVDNCSVDGTFEYCMELGCNYHRMEDTKSSAMETLNLAFSLANGKYILVLDDDAYIQDVDGIAKLVNIIEQDPTIFAVSANVVDNYGNPNMVISDGKRILAHDEVNHLGTIEWLEFHGACTMMRRDIGEILGWYNESFMIYANEMDLSIRAWNRRYKVLYTSDVVAIHNSGSSKPQLRNRFHGYKNILYVINCYFRWYTRLSMYALSVGVHTIRMLNTMRSNGWDIKYLMKWLWITVKYGVKVINPLCNRQFTNEMNHVVILNRLWTSYKMFIIGKIVDRDLSMYGLTGR